MAIDPTRFSRVSTGWYSSTKSLADIDPADTGPDASFINARASVMSAVATFGSVATFGTMNVTSALSAPAVQIGGGSVAVFSTGTAAISLGAIAPLESSSKQTFACSGLSRGDGLFVTVDSIYGDAAANRDVMWQCSSSSTVGEAHVWGVNSTLTSVTPTASTFIRWVRVKGGNYPAA